MEVFEGELFISASSVYFNSTHNQIHAPSKSSVSWGNGRIGFRPVKERRKLEDRAEHV